MHVDHRSDSVGARHVGHIHVFVGTHWLKLEGGHGFPGFLVWSAISVICSDHDHSINCPTSMQRVNEMTRPLLNEVTQICQFKRASQGTMMSILPH